MESNPFENLKKEGGQRKHPPTSLACLDAKIIA